MSDLDAKLLQTITLRVDGILAALRGLAQNGHTLTGLVDQLDRRMALVEAFVVHATEHAKFEERIARIEQLCPPLPEQNLHVSAHKEVEQRLSQLVDRLDALERVLKTS